MIERSRWRTGQCPRRASSGPRRARPLVARRPVWSGAVTRPIAARLPRRWWPAAAVVIKAIHTVAFLSIASLVGLVAWDGVRQGPRRRTGVGAAVGLGEAIVYVSNNQVCPLTPLAEEFGAASGTVTDIFLPTWVSRRVPLFSGTVLCLGLLLNLGAWRGSRRIR